MTSISPAVRSLDREKAQWTIMIYIGGDPGCFGSFERIVYKVFNITKKIPLLISGKMHIVGLIDFGEDQLFVYQKRGCALYRIRTIKTYEEINTGNYTTLRNFINYCKLNYPAERYLLFIQGHGAAWEYVCPDYLTGESNNTFDYLAPIEVRKALQESGGVNIFETGGCFMGNLEFVYEIRNYTKVYIGSEEGVSTFYPVDLFFATVKAVRKDPKASESHISSKIVIRSFRRYLLFYPLYSLITKKTIGQWSSRSSTISAIGTDKLELVAREIDNLSRLLLENLSKYRYSIELSLLGTEKFGGGNLIDLYDFLVELERYIKDPPDKLLQTIHSLKETLEETVLVEKHQIHHPGAQGLTIFFPVVGDRESFWYLEEYRNHNLEFTKATHWDEFLSRYLEYYR